MVDVNKQAAIPEARSAAAELLLYLAAASILFTIVSITALDYEVHNLYAASYYTTASIFDAIGFDQSASFIGIASAGGIPDYILLGISAIDGLVKMIIIGFVIAGLIDIITSLDARLSRYGLGFRGMKDHYVICGYSGLADKMIRSLEEKGKRFVVIDGNQTSIDLMTEAGIPCIRESYTTATGLSSAAVQDAKAVMFLSDNDYENMLGVITARSLNKRIKILAKADSSESTPRLHSAGADLCVVPEVLSGLEMGEAIVKKMVG